MIKNNKKKQLKKLVILILVFSNTLSRQRIFAFFVRENTQAKNILEDIKEVTNQVHQGVTCYSKNT